MILTSFHPEGQTVLEAELNPPETHPVLSYCEGVSALPYGDFHFRLDGSSYILARVAHLPLCLNMRYLFTSFFNGLLLGNDSQTQGLPVSKGAPMDGPQLVLLHIM